MQINSNQNKLIHALLARLEWGADKKRWLVLKHSKERTDSLRELSYFESNLLIKELQEEVDRHLGKTQRKVIHLMCLAGYVAEDGKPDYARINKFLQGIGSRNPGKKKLFNLNKTELNAVCTQVEQMAKKIMNDGK